VNIESLAVVMRDVDSMRRLKHCLGAAHVLQDRENVSLVMTAQSWLVLDGARVQDVNADLIEQVYEHQRHSERLTKEATISM